MGAGVGGGVLGRETSTGGGGGGGSVSHNTNLSYCPSPGLHFYVGANNYISGYLIEVKFVVLVVTTTT